MTISVIVPCLKRDADAERCLAEIRGQAADGGSELDLVVVEGVSPYGRAINEGLRCSRGDYIAWVDADDEVLPGWWRSICRALERRPDVVLMGWHDDRSGMDLAYASSEKASPNHVLRAVLRDEAPFGYLWNKVVRKALWEDERFDERWRFQADFALVPRVLNKARTVAVIAEPLYRYRFNPDGISRRKTAEDLREMFDVRWHRFCDWKGTDCAGDALVPFVVHVANRYEHVVIGGREPAEDEALAAQRKRLLKCALPVLRARIGWRDRVRTILTLLNWTWPQRLAWKLHGKGARLGKSPVT